MLTYCSNFRLKECQRSLIYQKCKKIKRSRERGLRKSRFKKRFPETIFEIAHNGKSLVSVFAELSANFDKTFILAWRLGTRVSLHGV